LQKRRFGAAAWKFELAPAVHADVFRTCASKRNLSTRHFQRIQPELQSGDFAAPISKLRASLALTFVGGAAKFCA